MKKARKPLLSLSHLSREENEILPAETLFIFRNIVNEPFRIFPAEAGVRDGFSVDAAADLLAAFLQITFHHNALHKFMDICI